MDLKSWKVAEKVAKNRANATTSELLMKAKLDFIKEKNVFQHAIDRNCSFIIADFFLPKRGLIIEVDGAYHFTPEQIKKDKKRDRFYAKLGYHLLRIENEDVLNFNPYSVEKYEMKPELIENEPFYGKSIRGKRRTRAVKELHKHLHYV